MKFLLHSLAAVLLPALAATVAPAQMVPGQSPTEPYLSSSAAAAETAAYPEQAGNSPLLTIRKRVDEVNVVFTAMNGHGKFVRDLSQSDFRVLDNNQPPQSILDFRRETNLPLRVGLLVDDSGSVKARFAFEQNAAISFLKQVIRQGTDRAFVIGFNSHSKLMKDFTDNTVALSSAIDNLNAGGGTALYDAIYLACKEKLLKAGGERPVRRAIIVLSDGEDNQSQVSLGTAIQMAQRAEVVVYAISTDDSGLVMRGDGVLEQLANATGGRAFFPYKMSDITKSFSAIEEELRSQYSVAYRPADLSTDGRYHSIEIVAVNKKVHVRARPGYYAPTQ
ncbi:MAG TPA: VWA domain-containing protein [Terriglobales bacterium]|nr:VWA domain-containing protein [Terriglobales bacterium]